jgi:hypothetical protein
LLSSWPETIRIFIHPVNDPPEVWRDEWTQRFNFTVPPCYSTCTFEEDNGARYPQPTPDALIWLGGDDIEESDLTAIITALDAPSTARLLTLDVRFSLSLSVLFIFVCLNDIDLFDFSFFFSLFDFVCAYRARM